LGRGGLAGLFSPRKYKSLSDSDRQEFLQWLVSDELNDGVESLRQENYPSAIKSLSQALKIDGRCGVACFLLALSYVRDLEASFEKKQGYDLESVIGKFQEALRIVNGAFVDAGIAPQAQGLRNTIGAYLNQLNEVVREKDRANRDAQPINKVVENFNNLMGNLQKQGIRSPKDLDNYERQFRNIRNDAERLRRAKSQEQGGKILGEVIQAIDSNLKQISDARGQAKGSQKVGECVEAFNAMMSYYQRSPVSNYSQRQEALRKVRDIQNKVSEARRHNPGPDGIKILDQLDNALRTVSQQLS
jgi:tetratricopeptide (TPR) repeat protein